MSNSTDCNICADTYNKSNREKICCAYCSFEACRSCCETYILSETKPKCMNTTCAKEWSRKFIRENFSNIFINTKFKEHLEDVLFNSEKALLPATQPFVEEIIRKEKLKKEINETHKLIEELYTKKSKLEYEYRRDPTISESYVKSASHFVRQCPAEGCRGFLSTQWKCGICEKWTCPECHELKGLTRDCDHKCDPNLVETAKLLNKDSKPCPKCQSLIFKISGCDQMWCTQCHTAFSWRTGAIESNIHNPHYYEWQRKNGGLARAAGDIECGRVLNSSIIRDIYELCKYHPNLIDHIKESCAFISGKKYVFTKEIDLLSVIIRQIIHNNAVELPRFQIDHFQKNQELRIRYLRKELTEESFKKIIQRNDKKNKKNTEIAQVIQLSITTSTDIIYRIVNDLKNSKSNNHHLNDLIAELNAVINYCNDIFKDISFTYNCVQYYFDEKFVIKTMEKKKENNEDSASKEFSEKV